MKTKILLVIFTTCILAGCKKDYTCSCFNPGGEYKTYEIKDTKKKAVEKCADYSKAEQTVPWSESGCALK